MKWCEFQRTGCTFKEWVKGWPSRSGTASIHPQIVPNKCFISEKKYIRALRYSIYQIISWIQKKEREKKFELLEDDSEPQLFKFYIHRERKDKINKDYNVQNKIKQISKRRSSYVCFPTTFSQLRTQNCILYAQLCQSYMFSLKRNQTPNSVVTWRGC